MKIISRKEALELGELYYFTGKPCIHGHIALRLVSCKGCYECQKIRTAQYWKDHPEMARRSSRNYRKNNKKRVGALIRLQQARRIHRAPIWLTEDDLWMMREIYELAELRTKLTKVTHEVDHIIPLKGKTVSGLHVPSNLQVIPAAENRKKHNTWDPDNVE